LKKSDWDLAKDTAMDIVHPSGNDSAVMDGIMLWITIAVMLVVFLPVVNAVLTSTPTIVTNKMDVGNLSGGGGVLGTEAMNATQISTTAMVGNSYGLLIVVLIILAAVVLLGVIAYLKGNRQG
jgi:hypothetical protein